MIFSSPLRIKKRTHLAFLWVLSGEVLDAIENLGMRAKAKRAPKDDCIERMSHKMTLEHALYLIEYAQGSAKES